MKKRSYKLSLPRWALAQRESWYAEFAARGLRVQKAGAMLTRFAPAPPARLRYRFEVGSDEGGLPAGQKEFYEECGWQYVLNAASPNKEAAKVFLSWAASLEGQEAYGRTFSRLPARTDVVDDPDFTVPGMEQLKSYLKTTTLVPRPLPVNSMEYINDVGALFQKYVSDELSFDDYIAGMQKCIKTYFPDKAK